MKGMNMLDTNFESHHCATENEKLAEMEQADTALQDSEKRYRRLFESAKDGILILNAETGRVVGANPYSHRDSGLCGTGHGQGEPNGTAL
ncbi:MAG: hypothetical protein WA081_20955 [Desulfosalsimonadaceae bacterium]